MTNESKSDGAKKILYGLVAVMVIASLAFRFIVLEYYEQSTLLFVGLPALITVLMIRFTSQPKTGYGITFKAITLFLLMAGIFLGEGMVCILFAAPVFYGVAALVIEIKKFMDRRKKSQFYTLVLLPVLLVCGEVYNINREPAVRNVTVTRVLDGQISLTELNKSPDFMSGLPVFFKLGFPKPIAIRGSGIDVGDVREIQFKSSTKGVGTLRLEILRSSSNQVIFSIPADDSHIAHWLAWKKVEVRMVANGDKTTTVTWSTDYRCELAPLWYFEPIEDFVVAICSDFLIDSYFESDAD